MNIARVSCSFQIESFGQTTYFDHVCQTSVIITVRGQTRWIEYWFLSFALLDYRVSFALLDYRVTNQIYLSVTQNTSSPNLSQSECLIRHCLISEFGAAWFPSYIYINLIGHSVIKQCKTRKSTFYRESVPWQWLCLLVII